MSTDRCMICNGDLTSFTELDQLFHIDSCIDTKIQMSMDEINYIQNSGHSCEYRGDTGQNDSSPLNSDSDEITIEDTTGMPDFEKMSKGNISEELDKFGLKKSLDLKEARLMLKEIWLYSNRAIFPKSLKKYQR